VRETLELGQHIWAQW